MDTKQIRQVVTQLNLQIEANKTVHKHVKPWVHGKKQPRITQAKQVVEQRQHHFIQLTSQQLQALRGMHRVQKCGLLNSYKYKQQGTQLIVTYY